MINSRLLPAFLRCKIPAVELITRQSWWINLPRADSKHWNYSTLILSTPVTKYRFALLCSGAWVGSQRKRPRCAFPLFSADLRLPNPPLLALNKGIFLMFYSFLVAPKGSMLSTLSNPLIVRCHSNSTKEAKAKFKGLSVALITRHQSGGAI